MQTFPTLDVGRLFMKLKIFALPLTSRLLPHTHWQCTSPMSKMLLDKLKDHQVVVIICVRELASSPTPTMQLYWTVSWQPTERVERRCNDGIRSDGLGVVYHTTLLVLGGMGGVPISCVGVAIKIIFVLLVMSSPQQMIRRREILYRGSTGAMGRYYSDHITWFAPCCILIVQLVVI